MAAILILEPIFEADFCDSSFGFRPGRNVHQALDRIREQIARGKGEVYDADLKGYFDTISHAKLMLCLQRHISDRTVLCLLRMWLQAPSEETDEHGQTTRRHRDSPGRCHLATTCESVSSLVRGAVLSQRWSSPLGQG